MLTLQDSIGLAGKCAIVAGGGAAGEGIGNGRAAAILLARAGAKVFVVDREKALAERTAQMVEEEGGVARAHGADLTKEDSVHGHGERSDEAIWACGYP